MINLYDKGRCRQFKNCDCLQETGIRIICHLAFHALYFARSTEARDGKTRHRRRIGDVSFGHKEPDGVCQTFRHQGSGHFDGMEQENKREWRFDEGYRRLGEKTDPKRHLRPLSGNH